MLKKCLFVFRYVAVCCMLASGTAIAEDLRDVLYDAYEIELNGFAEARLGYRPGNDPYERDRSIAEARLQLDMGRFFNWGAVKICFYR